MPVSPLKTHVNQGPVVQSIVSLNELISGQNVKCSSKYNIKFTGIFAEEMWVAAKATHIFSAKMIGKNDSLYVIFNDQSFNDASSNDIISFEQLGPGYLCNLISTQLAFFINL